MIYALTKTNQQLKLLCFMSQMSICSLPANSGWWSKLQKAPVALHSAGQGQRLDGIYTKLNGIDFLETYFKLV